MRPTRERRDSRIAGALALLGAGALLLLVLATDAYAVAIGSDPYIWCGTTLSLRQGLSPMFPPLYPALVAGAMHLPGVDPLEAAELVSGLAAAALPLLTFRVARSVGAATPAALVAGLAPFAVAGLFGMGLQFQPDALTTLLLLAAPPVVARWLARPGRGSLLLLAGFAVALHQAREHGLVFAGIAVGLAAWPRAPWRVRLARAAVVFGALCASPVLVHGAPALPWRADWLHRIHQATRFDEHAPLMDDGTIAEALATWRSTGDRLPLVLAHARFSLLGAPAAWLVVALGWLGLAGLPGPRRLALASVLVLPMPALVVLSQPRHVQVVVPAVLAAIAAVRFPAGWRRRAWRVAVLAASAWLAVGAPARWRGVAGAVHRDVVVSATRFPMGVCNRTDRELIGTPEGGGPAPAGGGSGGYPGGPRPGPRHGPR